MAKEKELTSEISLSEAKIVLRFRNENDIKKIHFLKNICESKKIKFNSYLQELILNHIEDGLKKQTLPDLKNTIYATTRRAVYVGTIGQNSFTSKAIKPLITQSQITDKKLNLILNILTNQIDLEKFSDVQKPPQIYLEEHRKFEELRTIIDAQLSKNIENYNKKQMHENSKAENFTEQMNHFNSIFNDEEQNEKK